MITKCKIIAEAGVNHNGSMVTAKKLIDVAVAAGADVVKFQSFRADALATNKAPKADYQISNTGSSQTQYQMLKDLELSEENHFELFEYCKLKGIEFLSTPFDIAGLDFLVSKNLIREVKVPSGEISNAPLLLAAGAKRLPVILSTGMSDLGEIEMALGVLAFGWLHGNKTPVGVDFKEFWKSSAAVEILKKNVTILQCTTEYPAPFREVNLRVIGTFKEHFGLQAGLSDHTNGIEASIAAVALGASLIEKHFTLSREMPGPDHKASLEPAELEAMIRSIRNVEVALGSGRKAPTKSEAKNTKIARKSLVALRAIKEGEAFSSENLGVKRPGGGKSPFLFWDYLGKTSDRAYEADDLI